MVLKLNQFTPADQLMLNTATSIGTRFALIEVRGSYAYLLALATLANVLRLDRPNAQLVPLELIEGMS